MDIIIDDSDMVDHRGAIDNGDIPGFIDIIVADIGASNILVRYKAPVLCRRHIRAAVCHIETDAGAHGRPAIVIITVPPGHPRRGILVSRHPHPAITVLEIPAAIVEGRPTPVIVRIPGPTLIGIDPVAIRGIGFKIGSHIRQPDIAVTGVVYPLSIRTQVIIKGLIAGFRLGLRCGRRRRQRLCYRRRGRRSRLLDYVSRTAGIQAQGQNG
jgi:hypothetical protein